MSDFPFQVSSGRVVFGSRAQPRSPTSWQILLLCSFGSHACVSNGEACCLRGARPCIKTVRFTLFLAMLFCKAERRDKASVIPTHPRKGNPNDRKTHNPQQHLLRGKRRRNLPQLRIPNRQAMPLRRHPRSPSGDDGLDANTTSPT